MEADCLFLDPGIQTDWHHLQPLKELLVCDAGAIQVTGDVSHSSDSTLSSTPDSDV